MSFSQLSWCIYLSISPMSSSTSIAAGDADTFVPALFLGFLAVLGRSLSLSASSSESSFLDLGLPRFLEAEVDGASALVSRAADLRPAFAAVLGLSIDFFPFFSFVL